MKAVVLAILLYSSVVQAVELQFEQLTVVQTRDLDNLMSSDLRYSEFESDGMVIRLAAGPTRVRQNVICRAYNIKTLIGSKSGIACLDKTAGWVYQ